MSHIQYSKPPPSIKLPLERFVVETAEKDVQSMKQILQMSPIGPEVQENSSRNQGDSLMSSPERRFGMRRDWLVDAKKHWLQEFDWEKVEDRIRSYPNFVANVSDNNGLQLRIRFVALFSTKPDAVPIAFYHGWPGSFMDFFKLLDLIKSQYSPETLPYHIIVPSLPGYTFSEGPPLEADFSLTKAATLLHNLMLGLGFSSYVVQGGDIGSIIARIQTATFEECKSMHLNMCSLPDTVDLQRNAEAMSDIERAAVRRGEEFKSDGFAYGLQQGTRPATVGLTLSSSPLALLCWIGEKWLEWSDDDPALDHILATVSLYWLTDTMSRSIYPYKENCWGMQRPKPFVEKPSAFSFFPFEHVSTPKCWVEQACNLIAYYAHESGGHFPAYEEPELLWKDVEDWIKRVWKV